MIALLSIFLKGPNKLFKSCNHGNSSNVGFHNVKTSTVIALEEFSRFLAFFEDKPIS